jgi:PAS domain S-box-containing protein
VFERPKYELETLRKDGELVLYRCRSGQDEAEILWLVPEQEHPSAAVLKRLENEASLKEELDPSWALQPIGRMTHGDRSGLGLRDPGGIPLSQLVGGAKYGSVEAQADGKALNIEWSLRVAISITGAMGALHKRGIIHKDIKPANVLVRAETGQCWLTGFGIASRLPRERQQPTPPEFIAGTLAYMAPEQTGRMNRSIDSRSDLYAFGVTLYQILTGTLPFFASEPLEWVHCHVARQPFAPERQSNLIPRSLSDIVMKLLAKAAEDRYQTAAGVEADLRRCLTEWESAGRISDFALGEHDIPDRLRIPEKLYGREGEIATLLGSFDRVVAYGRPELVLVSGTSGIGKSSVVNELHKVLVPARGLFASGKFDQYKRNVPYWTLGQAFQSLVRPLLAKSELELDQWREAFREALGQNGRLMIDLVPELELIIGPQPAVPELSPQDAKARFQLVFRRFVGVFARPEHPLALFIDDLQWLDPATLDFLKTLLTHAEVQHLMLIGAYRDDEVGSDHPLQSKLDTIRRAEARIEEIMVVPLSCQDLERLLADTLHRTIHQVRPLAQLVHTKTAGNPFFAVQFITSLADERFLRFDDSLGRWRWDLDRIRAKGCTENVADLITERVSRLAIETQRTLQDLACLGNRATVSTLSIVHGSTEEKLFADLWEAECLELVVRSEEFYQFIHDRVQEAVYSLIPVSVRAQEHLRIARLLRAGTPVQNQEQTVFEIVNQFNRAAELIVSPEERRDVAELNLLAGKRAKAASAHASALKYFSSGAALLPADVWEHEHALAFDLELSRSECEFLIGQLAAAEIRLDLLWPHIIDPLERASIACLRMALYAARNQADRAISVCLEYLRGVGIDWSPHPDDQTVREEFERVWQKLGSRTFEDLLDAPLMEEAAPRGAMRVLAAVLRIALFTDSNLASLAVCAAVGLSLEKGVADASCYAFVLLARVAHRGFGDYAKALGFGHAGYQLVERRGLVFAKISTYLGYVSAVLCWTKPIRASREILRQALEEANRIGDVRRAAYVDHHLNSHFLFGGDALAEAQNQAESGLDFAKKTYFDLVIDIIDAQLALIRTLRGQTLEFGCLGHDRSKELELEKHLSSNNTLAIAACWYWIRKMQARYFAGDYQAALQASFRAEQLIWTSPCYLEEAEYHFYSGLCRAAACDSADDKAQLLSGLSQHHQRLEAWARDCPENFENRAALLGAEIARIEGRHLAAEHLYEQAIRSASSNGFVHNEALADELAGRFYQAIGFDKIGRGYLRDARYCYLRWGADGKVRQLDELYPYLRENALAIGPVSTMGTPIDQLDLTTLVQALQTLSSEMVLEKLIDTLMRMVIEHAAAQRGLLILGHGEDQRIEAEATTSGDAIIVDGQVAPVTGNVLAQSIVRYVNRTKESVILDDASVENAFSDDDYLRPGDSKSVLCLPLVKQATLTGMLYLENRLAPRVFTARRLAVLKLLASQAAISLDNARLYRDLRQLNVKLSQENSDRKKAEEALRVSEQRLQDIIDHTSAVIFVKDLELRYLLVNREFERRHRVRRDYARGKTDFEIHPKEVAEALRRNDVQVIAAGAPIQFEEVVPSEQEDRWYLCAKFLLRGHEGRPYAICGIATDITERRQSEDALRQAQAEIARVSRMTTMEQLSASIAHELNQPLAAVVTSGDACLNWLSINPPNLTKARAAVGRMVRDGNRASDVLKRVRDLVRKTPVGKSAVNLNKVIEEVLALVDGELRKNRVECFTGLDLNLPSVCGDFVQLQQVVMNLVMNAIESLAAVDRSRVLRIQTWVEERAQQRARVLVAVHDSGLGLSPEQTVRVFEAFYSTKSESMGMGLWICRSIVEAHEGRLTAGVNETGGATFQLALPAYVEPTRR